MENKKSIFQELQEKIEPEDASERIRKNLAKPCPASSLSVGGPANQDSWRQGQGVTMLRKHGYSPRKLMIEGNIGAGKSTMLRIIEENLAVQVVYEPHEAWQSVGGENLLEKFYTDGKRWAYTFQTYAFVTRIVEQEKKATESTAAVQVLERSVYSDRYCFAKNSYELGTMNSLEWKLYQEWFSWLVDLYTTPPYGFIYMRTDPEVCFERLKKRNRSEEQGVSLEYLKMIHQKHEDWILEKKEVGAGLAQVPVLVIDCNAEFENDKEFQQRILSKITDFFTVPWQHPTYGPETVKRSCC